MAFNPPPEGIRRAAALPFIGWVVLAGGIYVAFKALTHEVQNTGRPPRHASGEETSARDAVKFVLMGTVGVVASTGFLWWGIHSRLLSVLALGIAILGMSVPVIPNAVSALNWLLRRGKY
jgi:hypothetical protein